MGLFLLAAMLISLNMAQSTAFFAPKLTITCSRGEKLSIREYLDSVLRANYNHEVRVSVCMCKCARFVSERVSFVSVGARVVNVYLQC